MKIYSLMLVKNEEDIIASTLRAAAEWSDKLIVFDNGSTDRTWKIVNDMASLHPCIIPFAQDGRPFRIGLRALMFDAFKHEMTDEDWWCIRMDADEFFVESPRKFLQNIPKRFKQVSKASIDFHITKEDVDELEFSGHFETDKDKIRYHNPQTWAEVRFLRHSKRLKWNIDQFKPQPCGLTYPKQIRVLHYQFRSPQQMENRFGVRKKAREEGCGSFSHEKGNSWKDYLRTRETLIYHQPGTDFVTSGNRNKFNKLHTRIFKSLLTLTGYYG
jgi:hypothetical protein